MTAALRQQDTPASHTASATSITSNTPGEAYLVGSSIQVNLALQYVNAQSITVQDSEGQTYTYLNSTGDSTDSSYLAVYVLNNNQYNAAFTVTATLLYATTDLNISVQEFSGTNNAGPDVASFPSRIVAPGTGANAISIILSSYQSSGIAMGVMCAVAGSGNLTAGTGFTGGTSFAAGAGFTHSLFETKVITSSGSNNVTWTDATDGGTSTYLGYAVIWDSASTPTAITAVGQSGSLGIASLTSLGVLSAVGQSGSLGRASISANQMLGYGSGSLGVATIFNSTTGSAQLAGQSGSLGIASLTGAGALTAYAASGSLGIVSMTGLAALQSRGSSGSLGIASLSAGLAPGVMYAIGMSGSLGIASLSAFYSVPYVLGLQLSQAEQVLLQYGYANVDVDYVYDTVSAPGIVLQQAPLAQTTWPLTAPVTLIVSQGPYVPSTQMPISQLKVTARQFSLEEMVSREWGSSFRAPDHRIYNFTGRAFDSTDIGTTGIYRKNIENAPIVAPPGTTQLANGELILPNGQIIIPGAPPPGGN